MKMSKLFTRDPKKPVGAEEVVAELQFVHSELLKYMAQATQRLGDATEAFIQLREEIQNNDRLEADLHRSKRRKHKRDSTDRRGK